MKRGKRRGERGLRGERGPRREGAPVFPSEVVVERGGIEGEVVEGILEEGGTRSDCAGDDTGRVA